MQFALLCNVNSYTTSFCYLRGYANRWHHEIVQRSLGYCPEIVESSRVYQWCSIAIYVHTLVFGVFESSSCNMMQVIEVLTCYILQNVNTRPCNRMQACFLLPAHKLCYTFYYIWYNLICKNLKLQSHLYQKRNIIHIIYILISNLSLSEDKFGLCLSLVVGKGLSHLENVLFSALSVIILAPLERH